ncbi:MAG: hypothetical protein N2482_03145 [Patescibacteria group bacterium]|nr:hypothetical protein [Patescibacteria group bacterium]
MDFKKAKEIFNSLFQGVDGYQISFQARKKLGFYDRSLTYGEINFDSFYEIIKMINSKKEDVFYDLGSGTGKAVLASHLLFDFKKSIGIEILDNLYEISLSIKEKYEREIKPGLVNEKIMGEIDFVLGDILETDFSEADIVFANSTCFPDEIMNNLEQKLLTLKKGARIITLTNRLKNEAFLLLMSKLYQQNWGQATVNFYVKESAAGGS